MMNLITSPYIVQISLILLWLHHESYPALLETEMLMPDRAVIRYYCKDKMHIFKNSGWKH